MPRSSASPQRQQSTIWWPIEKGRVQLEPEAGSSSGKHGSARRDWPFIEFFLLKTGDMGMELLPEFFLLRVGVSAGRSSEK